MTVTFEYGVSPVKSLECETIRTTKAKTAVKSVIINGRKLAPTKRFWQSLQMRFRFSKNIFKYFTHSEVFERISKVAPNDTIRWCIEKVDGAPERLMACTNPSNPIIPYTNLLNIISQYGGGKVSYSNGVVRSNHTPKIQSTFDISGDAFSNQFIVDTPIDGFGKPSVYLSLLRQICTNGAIGFAPAFRSELSIGKKNDSIEFSLCRALEGYNNEEGWSALRQRFESATKSWASVNEAMKLQQTIISVHGAGQLKNVKKLIIGGDLTTDIDTENDNPVLRGLLKITGNLNQQYGLANIDALSTKRQRTLPAACKIYDLLNFASEVATHHAAPEGARKIQGYIGTLLANEYDMEGTGEVYGDWKDFFIENSETAETIAAMNMRSNL